MTSVVVMTIYDRSEEVIEAVFAGLSLPGNTPDALVVCYDRASGEAKRVVEGQCWRLGIKDLRETRLDGDFSDGPRCPSLAWNTALALVKEDHAFCISSDIVLAPHSVGMAYHLATLLPDSVIVGRAEHCGQGYKWSTPGSKMEHRVMTSSANPHPLGFNWLLPMAAVREIAGYDESYMHGLCYEDDDFVARLWEKGTDLLFCDDIAGFHLEHDRSHLTDRDGRVTRNEKLYVSKFGHKNYVKDKMFKFFGVQFDVGMSAMLHAIPGDLATRCFRHQRKYGDRE